MVSKKIWIQVPIHKNKIYELNSHFFSKKKYENKFLGTRAPQTKKYILT
jgi:hypothetical protein